MSAVLDFDQVYEMNERLGVIGKAAEKQGLSLREIHHLEDQVMVICQKAQKVATSVLTNDVIKQGMKLAHVLDERRSSIQEGDKKLLQALGEIDFSVDALRDRIIFFTEDETVQQLANLYQQVQKICEAHPQMSPRVDKAIWQSLEKIAEVDFCLRFSVYLELLEESYQQNFAQRIKHLAGQFMQNKKSAHLEFMTFSEKQRQAISAFPFEKGRAALSYLQHLQDLASLAKMALYDDPNKAYLLLQEHPERIRIEEIIWEKTGKKWEDTEFRELLPIGIMAFIEEHVLN